MTEHIDVKKEGMWTRYEIVKVIGQGAWGIVYLGNDTRLNRTVALKCLLGSEAAIPDDVRQRFEKEIDVLTKLTHPHIVAITDTGKDPRTGRTYIIMEHVEGESLDRVMKKGADIPHWADIGVQICRALDFAYKKKIIHRDVKPANILMTTDLKSAKLADFGIVRLDVGEKTPPSQILGTREYMSPEQYTGKPLDGRSDLFSVGVVLYEMATRRKPFAGENDAATMYQVLNNTPDAPHNISPDISLALSDVIMKALAKNPSERFQSGEEMARALEGALRQKRPPKRPPWWVIVIVLIVTALAAWGIRTFQQPSIRPGKVDFQTEPIGAKIWVNDMPKGIAPLTVNLHPGSYALTVTKDGYYPVEATLTVTEGEQIPLQIHLIPKEDKS